MRRPADMVFANDIKQWERKMSGLSPVAIGLFVFVVVIQLFAVATLPRTEGFTNLPWTAACLGAYGVSYWAMASIIRSGMPLGILIPLLSAVIPLCAIAIGVLLHGESASPSKLALLGFACVLVGLAGATE